VIELPDGLKARVTHRRYVQDERYRGESYTRYEWRQLGVVPEPRGGITTAELLKDDVPVAFGLAVCSREDQYVSRIGRDKAVGRAIGDLRLREAIAQLWSKYMGTATPKDGTTYTDWAERQIDNESFADYLQEENRRGNDDPLLLEMIDLLTRERR
jgi:hypothetical protein